MPGVCLPEKAPFPPSPLSFFFLSPSHHPSLLSSSLISLIKDILCSPLAIALQQQIRQPACTHTHIIVCCGEPLGPLENVQAETDRITDGQRDKRRAGGCGVAPIEMHRLVNFHPSTRVMKRMHAHPHSPVHVKHTRSNKLSDLKYSANKQKWVALTNWHALMNWRACTPANNTRSNEQVAPKVTSACWVTEMDAASEWGSHVRAPACLWVWMKGLYVGMHGQSPLEVTANVPPDFLCDHSGTGLFVCLINTG